MKKIYSLIVLALMLLCGSSAWAANRVTLVDIDFSTWSDQTICEGSTSQETVNGFTFYSKNNSKQFDIASGVMTWPDNNYNSSNYFIGIPLENVNGNIYLSAWNGISKTRITYCWKGGATAFSTNPGSGTSTASAAPTTATIASTNDSGWLYVGRQGSGLTTCTRILIETDAPARTETGRLTVVTGVTINGEAISADDLATLKSTKSLELTDEYIVAPAVVLSTLTTITYDSGDPDEKTGTVTATVAEEGNTFVATAEVGTDTYTITVNKNLAPALEVSPAAVSLESVKIGTATATITVAGANLTGDEVTITLPDVAGLTCTPTTLPITDGSVNATITLSYKSVEDVAEATANVTLTAGETTATVAVTYSSTAAVTTIVPVSEATTWNWAGANKNTINLETLGLRDQAVCFANFDGWVEGFNATALEGEGQYLYNSTYFQGNWIKFNTTVPGIVTVKFSNTNTVAKNGLRTLRLNGVDTKYSANEGSTAVTAVLNVNAGEVTLSGWQTSAGTNTAPEAVDKVAYLRIYSIEFTPGRLVTISEAGFCSFAPAMDVTIPEGVQAWALESKTDINGEVMTLNKVTGSIEAGKGVVLTGEAGDYKFVGTSGATTTSLLQGAGAEGVELTEGEAYILGAKDGQPCFYLCGAGTLGAYKAYLPKATMKAPVLRISFGDATTAIENVEVDATDAAAYNVLGQKVNNSYKGIVIKNGKKVIVK